MCACVFIYMCILICVFIFMFMLTYLLCSHFFCARKFVNDTKVAPVFEDGFRAKTFL